MESGQALIMALLFMVLANQEKGGLKIAMDVMTFVSLIAAVMMFLGK